jgi:MarR family transcriptional regulator, organic hydroperoxide resistance regulator
VAGQTLQSYLVYLLSEAERRVNRQLAEQFRDEGVPVEYWRILQALADGHGHSMGELADAVLMNHPTLTKTLDRMVSEALVYRRQSTDDRRRIAIYAATSGRALLRRLDAQAVEHQNLIAGTFGIGETGQLMDQLQELLRCLATDGPRAGDN